MGDHLSPHPTMIACGKPPFDLCIKFFYFKKQESVQGRIPTTIIHSSFFNIHYSLKEAPFRVLLCIRILR